SSTFPRMVEFQLVVESDSVCELEINHFDVSYHRSIQVFDSEPKDKRALRLSGDASSQEVTFRLPSGAAGISANVKVTESFGAGGAPASLGCAIGSPPTETAGALVEPAFSISGAVSPSEPVRATGVAFALLPLTAKAGLRVELREDSTGQPTGKKLADGQI